jgi:hypothetical protein
MIFQTRLTIVILFISLFAETGSSASCGDRRGKTSPPANTNANTSPAMNTENKNQPVPSTETVWGGLHVRLVITSGGAEVEFDCAHGEIKVPLKADAQGHFDLPGTFVRERGGPARADETESGEPVRYSGRIEGDKMSLTITLSSNNEKLDDFSLTRGNQGRLFKCK